MIVTTKMTTSTITRATKPPDRAATIHALIIGTPMGQYTAYNYAGMHALRHNLHSNRAGLGSHKPEFLQVAVSVPTSEKPGSHWKVMTELSVWSVLVSNTPLSGGVGRTQITIGEGMVDAHE